jgi:hypothetical protein
MKYFCSDLTEFNIREIPGVIGIRISKKCISPLKQE